MIVFKGIIDLIGALLFTWFIAEFFEFKDNKKRFIFLVTLIQLICLQIFQIYHCFNSNSDNCLFRGFCLFKENFF